MERDFWITRWQTQQIGFHLPEVNARLVAHRDVLPAEGARVFVPLCGKSVDLAWLSAQGYEVVGVELSELAVRAFFAERGLTPRIVPSGELTGYHAPGLTVYCGDFFALDREHLAGVSAFYDRAALVALPPALRKLYAEHVAALLRERAVGLLVCFDYAQSEMSGPPFSVQESEVRALYEPAFTVELAASYDILADEPRFRVAGLTSLHERVYRLARA